MNAEIFHYNNAWEYKRLNGLGQICGWLIKVGKQLFIVVDHFSLLMNLLSVVKVWE